MSQKASKTKERILRQNQALQDWDKPMNPPEGISLHDKLVRRVIFEMVGGRKTSEVPLESIRLLCKKHPELEAVRKRVIEILRDEKNTDLLSLCVGLNSAIDELPEDLAPVARHYQMMGATRIRRRKRLQMQRNGNSEELDVADLMDLQRKINEAVATAIQDMASHASPYSEALFEMLATINANVKIAMERFGGSVDSPAIQRMMDKAFHSVREAISGLGVIEQNSVAYWGSARSQPCYDRIVEEVSYRAAAMGLSSVSGGGPGTMGSSLKGTNRYIQESFERGEDPQVEAIGLPSNFSKMDEAPSPDMTMRIDHSDLDIRKLLLRTTKLIYMFPGRLGTDDEMYDVLVELNTDYSNLSEKPGAVIPNLLIVGGFQRQYLLRHLVQEIKKTRNKHYLNSEGKKRPLFYFLPVDHAKLKEEEKLPDQMQGEETQRLTSLLTHVTEFLSHPENRHLDDFTALSATGIVSSIELEEQFEKNPLIDLNTLEHLMDGKTDVDLPKEMDHIRARFKKLFSKEDINDL